MKQIQTNLNSNLRRLSKLYQLGKTLLHEVFKIIIITGIILFVLYNYDFLKVGNANNNIVDTTKIINNTLFIKEFETGKDNFEKINVLKNKIIEIDKRIDKLETNK